MDSTQLFTALKQMSIPQAAIARELNVSPTTVSGWVKHYTPSASVEDLFGAIDSCRKNTNYQDNFTFIHQLLVNMDASSSELSHYESLYNDYFKQKGSEKQCFHDCMVELLKKCFYTEKSTREKPEPEEGILSPQRLLIALTELDFIQAKIAKEVNYEPAVVSGWIKKGKNPDLPLDKVFTVIEKCRVKCDNEKDFKFIHRLLTQCKVPASTSKYFETKYSNYKNKYDSDDVAYDKCIKDIIRMSWDKTPFPQFLVPDTIPRTRIGIGIEHIIGVDHNGKLFATGLNSCGQKDVNAWDGMISVTAGWKSSFGLRSDGTCAATGAEINNNCGIKDWSGIVAIASGTWHTLGLRHDGTVTAFGRVAYGQCDTSQWTNIIEIAAGHNHSVGLTRDGTVIAIGNNEDGQCEVADWKGIKHIAAAGDHTIGLTSDGKIVAAGDCKAYESTYNTKGWKELESIATGTYHIAGLKKDGTVIAAGHNANGQCDVYKWWNVKEIYAGFFKTIGVRRDGHVYSTLDKYGQYCDASSSWTLFAPFPDSDKYIDKFEISRQEALRQISEIIEQLQGLAPFIQRFDVLSSTVVPHDRVADETIQKLFNMSKHLYLFSNELKPLPVLTDILDSYSAAFVGFYKTLDKKEILCDDNSTKAIYDPTTCTYLAFRSLLTTVNHIQKRLLNI